MALSRESKEELIEYLKENLTVRVSVSHDNDYYTNGFRVSVKLALEGDEITSDSDSFTLPGDR